MKRLFYLVSLLAMQFVFTSSIIVEALDGTSQVYDMENVNKLDFTNYGNLKVVKTDGTSDTKAISATRKVVFSSEDAPATAISESQASALKVYPNPAKSELTVEGANDDIFIFSANGNLISRIKAEDKAVINVSSFTNGVYILRSGDSAVRIIKSK